MTKTKDAKIYLILHNVRSAYNVGSIFRTADAAGVSKIFLCGYTPDPKKDYKVAKTALGAQNSLPWENYKQTWRLLEQLHKEGIKIIALEQIEKSKNIFSAEGRSAFGGEYPRVALIVGHERNGLSKKILEYVNDIVEIPMYGKKESLNVAVATGIALYQIK